MDHVIDSSDSESQYNEFIEDKINEEIEKAIEAGIDTDGAEVVVELGDIQTPTFTYHDPNGGNGGQGNQGPGREKGGLKFGVPFKDFMKRLAEKLGLPMLNKAGQGKIKEVIEKYKTFGPTGTILDKKRTFKRALKRSIISGEYNPGKGKFNLEIKKKDRRFKQPETIEKPKFKAVVFFIGDISFSTYGERLKEEKKYVGFIQSWLRYNYGNDSIDFRYIVHEASSYEVSEDNFFKVSNSGGTDALEAWQLVYDLAVDDYDINTTNFYCFYFGDGELFGDESDEIATLIQDYHTDVFNRIGIIEVLPSNWSNLLTSLEKSFSSYDKVVRYAKHEDKKSIVPNVKHLFLEYTPVAGQAEGI